MATSGGDSRVKELNRIWGEWGLEPDVTLAKAQQKALSVVAGWLEKGRSTPEIALRATQILVLDPERTDRKNRPCWGTLRDELLGVWSNAGSGADHLLYAQALLLSAWPADEHEGGLTLPALLTTPFDIMHGRNNQAASIMSWREAKAVRTTRKLGAARATTAPPVNITPFSPKKIHAADALQEVSAQYNRPEKMIKLLEGCAAGIDNLGGGLATLTKEVGGGLETLTTALNRQAENAPPDGRRKLDLLWWGQARYCKSERKPYRRLPRQDDVIWWAPREAAELSCSLEVEPAASYVVETLTSLGHDTFEKKTLRQWMTELHDTLSRARDKTPFIGESLEGIANVDALGLPVTWVRMKAARKDSLDGAEDAIALDLSTEIDRGEWAAWIFRETLLDLRLSEGA